MSISELAATQLSEIITPMPIRHRGEIRWILEDYLGEESRYEAYSRAELKLMGDEWLEHIAPCYVVNRRKPVFIMREASDEEVQEIEG